ncbi:MAG: zf-HC2 domain-containing protein, partial [Candidatus Hydrogenedentota bacterium]
MICDDERLLAAKGAVLSGEASEEERCLLEEHIATCERCRVEMEELGSFRRRLLEVYPPEGIGSEGGISREEVVGSAKVISIEKSRRRRWRWRRGVYYTAGALAASLLAAVFFARAPRMTVPEVRENGPKIALVGGRDTVPMSRGNAGEARGSGEGAASVKAAGPS